MICIETKTWSLKNLPTAVWVPDDMPGCYQGTPLEIFQQIGAGHEPQMDAEAAIQAYADDMDLELPEDASTEQRAAIVLAVLLTTGLVKEMPKG